jgi:hypothetical protein
VLFAKQALLSDDKTKNKLKSDDGLHVLTLQQDGNLVLTSGDDSSLLNVCWASNTNSIGTGPYRCDLQGQMTMFLLWLE